MQAVTARHLVCLFRRAVQLACAMARGPEGVSSEDMEQVRAQTGLE